MNDREQEEAVESLISPEPRINAPLSGLSRSVGTPTIAARDRVSGA